MRLILGTALALGALASACAALSGLDSYSAGGADASLAGDDGPAMGDDAPATDDVVTGNEDAAEAGTIVDAAGDHSAVDVGAPPACAPSNCNGCCLNGTCYGGGSVATCGTSGQTCRDCTNQGGACNSGVCGPKMADAGPMCTASNLSACKNLCSGTGIYATCCKKDGTCGCMFPFAPCN